MNPLLAAALALVKAWTRLYTSGLPAAQRGVRRGEIASDLWESVQDAPGSQVVLAASVIVRLFLGIPDDLGWRREQVTAEIAWRWRLVATALVVGAVALWLNRAAQPEITVEELMKLVPAQEPGPRLIDVPPPPPPPPPPCAPDGFPQPPGACTR